MEFTVNNKTSEAPSFCFTYEMNSEFLYHPEAKKGCSGFYGFGSMEDCEGVLGM